ncbi:MAG: hypothetical protein NC218_12240, partial [Acetobacter sp.]|nr:hypothetical protein [Acetobacter sp.]
NGTAISVDTDGSSLACMTDCKQDAYFLTVTTHIDRYTRGGKEQRGSYELVKFKVSTTDSKISTISIASSGLYTNIETLTPTGNGTEERTNNTASDTSSFLQNVTYAAGKTSGWSDTYIQYAQVANLYIQEDGSYTRSGGIGEVRQLVIPYTSMIVNGKSVFTDKVPFTGIRTTDSSKLLGEGEHTIIADGKTYNITVVTETEEITCPNNSDIVPSFSKSPFNDYFNVSYVKDKVCGNLTSKGTTGDYIEYTENTKGYKGESKTHEYFMNIEVEKQKDSDYMQFNQSFVLAKKTTDVPDIFFQFYTRGTDYKDDGSIESQNDIASSFVVATNRGSSYSEDYYSNGNIKYCEKFDYIEIREKNEDGILMKTVHNVRPLYNCGEEPSSFEFSYNNEIYKIIPQVIKESESEQCPSDYFELKKEPDSNYFKYEYKDVGSKRCYKVTGCKEKGFFSATADRSCTGPHCITPTPYTFGKQTCYINWPSYLVVDAYMHCGNGWAVGGGTCSDAYGGDLYCCLNDKKSGVYWARGTKAPDFENLNEASYKVSVDEVKNMLYLDSINIPNTSFSQSLDFRTMFGFGRNHQPSYCQEIISTASTSSLKDIGKITNLLPCAPRCYVNTDVGNEYFIYSCRDKRGFSSSDLADDQFTIIDNITNTEASYRQVSGSKVKLCLITNNGNKCEDVPLRMHLNGYPENQL